MKGRHQKGWFGYHPREEVAARIILSLFWKLDGLVVQKNSQYDLTTVVWRE